MPHVASCGARRRRGHDALASDNLIRDQESSRQTAGVFNRPQQPETIAHYRGWIGSGAVEMTASELRAPPVHWL